jgi:hypothetical protein
MSLFMGLMIGGWTAAAAMFAFFALKESGQLLRIRRRMALWLYQPASQAIVSLEHGFEAESEDAV